MRAGNLSGAIGYLTVCVRFGLAEEQQQGVCVCVCVLQRGGVPR